MREARLGVGQALAQGELAQPRIQQRLERMRQRPAEQFDGSASISSRSSGLPPCRHSVAKSSSARPASACSRIPNSRNGFRQRRGALQGPQLPVGQPVVHAGQAVRVVELGGDHRRHAQRHQMAAVLGGQRAQHPHQRQVGRRPRLVEPFLADRPAAVMCQPRQVGVQDEGEQPGRPRTGCPSRPHRDRDQVEAVVDVAVGRVDEVEVRRCVTEATSASRSAGHGASASARAIWASMIDPPCRASSSASRSPWKTPSIDSTEKPARISSSVSSAALSSRVWNGLIGVSRPGRR